MTEEWQSQSFRQNVISKIHDMLPQNGPEPNKNASTMENHIFRKSRTKDEYMGLVAKLFMHYKDMSQRLDADESTAEANTVKQKKSD